MKRYNIMSVKNTVAQDHGVVTAELKMSEVGHGAWVKYEDVEATIEAKDQRIAELEAVVDTGIRCMEQRNVAYERIAELEQALLRIEELSPSGLHKNSVFTPNWYDTFRRAQAIAEDTRKEDKP